MKRQFLSTVILCTFLCSFAPSGFSSTLWDRTATGFWSSPSTPGLTTIGGQQEDWYSYTPYIAEFECTVSNFGFFYWGLQHGNIPMLLAGLFSTLSHAIPYETLHKADIGAAVFFVLSMAPHAPIILKDKFLLALTGATVVSAIAEKVMAKTFYTKTRLHVLWHILGSYTAHLILQKAA